MLLGTKPATVPAGDGTGNENATNEQGAVGQGERRLANQNRGLRARLQASRRARQMSRISEDEHDGMSP